MTEGEARREVIARLLEKAEKALAAARREYEAEDFDLVMNRIYYACFYALSAVLLRENKTFSKHAGIRSALHQDLIRTGTVASEYGRFYDEAFDARQEADYGAVTRFDAASVLSSIRQAERFVSEMRRLLTTT